MTTVADDFREPDLTCINVTCPQCKEGKCTSPDPEVCTGNPNKGKCGLDPCPDRKV